MADRNLKPGWKVWRFDQMAINVNDRIDDPGEADVDYYVGLEHLDPESLKIRRWGSPSDVNATKLLFREGDIIFGRRRAYQRKLAVADFDGICSAHAMVLRARPDVVLPEFLPFFMQSDLFMNRAVEISVGSLSPTINWKTLAEQEFALPPLEKQCSIAKLLWQIIHAGDSLRELILCALTAEDSYLKNVFGLYSDDNSRWERVSLRRLAIIQTGVAKGKRAQPGKTVEVPYLSVSNVQDGFLDLSEVKEIIVEKDKVEQYILKEGDVLMTEGGDPDKLGRGTVWQNEVTGCVHQNHIFAVRPNSQRLNSWFLAALARSTYGKQYFLSGSKRTSNLATINKKQVGDFPVPLPDLKTQRKIVTDWTTIRNAQEQARDRFQTLRSMYSQLLNSMLEELE